jgi:predicted NBD/HSP70 family sugar kinase
MNLMNKIVFDIGGTNTRIARSNDNQLVGIEKFPTAKVEDFISKLKRYADKAKINVIRGAIAGGVRNGQIIFVPNLDASWQGIDLKDELQRPGLNLELLLNDVEAGSLAQINMMSRQGINHFGYLAIGTGFGGARITNGSIAINDFGFEPGHLRSTVQPELTLEDYYGGHAVRDEFRIEPYQINDDDFWRCRSQDLGMDLAQLAIGWSASNLVLAGSMVLGTPAYKIDQIQNSVNQTIMNYSFVEQIKIYKSNIGDEANMIGLLES